MQKLLQYWKNKLLLNDWTIKLIEDCNVSDFILKDVCGETEWDSTNKCAVIRIVSEKEYGNRIVPFIKERILLHELLHIKFCLLWESNTDTQNLILHQIIEDMARTLYKAHKEKVVNNGKDDWANTLDTGCDYFIARAKGE